MMSVAESAERLGVSPQEALVVEDSTYGVAAGAASGAFVTALKDNRFSFDQSPADMRIKSLAEIPAIVAGGGAAYKGCACFYAHGHPKKEVSKADGCPARGAGEKISPA